MPSMTRLREGERRRFASATPRRLPDQRVAEQQVQAVRTSSSEQHLHSVREACELVEQWCLRRIVPAGDALIDELERLVREQGERIDDPARFVETEWEFHRAIVRAANNPVFVEFYGSFRQPGLDRELRAVADDAERASRVVREHRAIIDALRSSTPDDASDALARHLSGMAVAARLGGVA